MRVELVSDEDPGRVRVHVDGLLDVSNKVLLGSCRPNGWHDHLSCYYIEVCNEAKCAVAAVLKLLTLNQSRPGWQCGVAAFKGLDTGFFIDADNMAPLLMKRCCLLVGLADLSYISIILLQIL